MSQPVHGPSEKLMLGGADRRLIVLRHGQTTHNAAGIWQGQLDTELSDTGRHQAEQAAEVLAHMPIARIVSSDLRRAAQTARIVADRTGLEVVLDSRLREIDVGQWQGRSSTELQATDGDVLDAVARGDDPRRGGTGETVAEVGRRSVRAAHEFVDDLQPEQLGLIVCHGVVGRALAAGLAGLDQRAAWLGLGSLHNCHWVQLREGRHGWRIEKWNVQS